VPINRSAVIKQEYVTNALNTRIGPLGLKDSVKFKKRHRENHLTEIKNELKYGIWKGKQ